VNFTTVLSQLTLTSAIKKLCGTIYFPISIPSAKGKIHILELGQCSTRVQPALVVRFFGSLYFTLLAFP